jgi:hypothetical protein
MTYVDPVQIVTVCVRAGRQMRSRQGRQGLPRATEGCVGSCTSCSSTQHSPTPSSRWRRQSDLSTTTSLEPVDSYHLSHHHWPLYGFLGHEIAPGISHDPVMTAAVAVAPSPASQAPRPRTPAATDTARPNAPLPASRHGSRQAQLDPLSDRATTALIRRTLCAHKPSDKNRDAQPPIDELLPPLTSRNDVDLQLYAFLAIILRDSVQTWYVSRQMKHLPWKSCTLLRTARGRWSRGFERWTWRACSWTNCPISWTSTSQVRILLWVEPSVN